MMEKAVSRPQFAPVYCCRRPSWGRQNSHVSLALLLLLSVFHRSSQVLEFVEEPEVYYYTRPSFSTIIPCQVIDTDGTSATPTYVSSLFSINGSSVSSKDMLPPYHHFWLRNNVVSGLLVVNTSLDFSGWTYGCSAEYARQTITSGNATLYLGDGRPLAPVEDPMYMADTGLTSLTIMWGISPVPPDAPLWGYNITYTSLNDSNVDESVETSSNATMITLESLKPGQTYVVAVQGYNRLGSGEWSGPLTVTVMVGSVPPPPSKVVAEALDVTSSHILLSVQWMPVEVQSADGTPVLNYSIYYYDLALPAQLIKTVNSSQTSTIVELSRDVVSPFRVGVAARNLAGYSEIAYVEPLIVIDPVLTTPSPRVSSPLLIGIIVAAIVLLIVASALIFIVILCLTRKMKSMGASYSFSGADTESPEVTPEIIRKKFEQQNGTSDLDGVEDHKSETKRSRSIEMADLKEGGDETRVARKGSGEIKVGRKNSGEVRVVRPKRHRLPSVEAINPVRLSFYDSKTL